LPTQVINTRYEVIETEPPADGSAFVVSKARDVVEGRVVALQVLSTSQPAGMLPALRAAISEAMRLDHPNITHVYDQGEVASTGDLYVASEYVRAITLQERIRRVAPFSLTVAADIAVSVAEALDYAHRTGVIHGDLRPQDVLLSPEGQIKVANFAYARILSGVGATSKPPSVGDDLTSLGAMLYEMLTGVLPPPGSGMTPPSPRAANPGVPPALEGIVQKALHPDVALRYRSAGAMLLDLQAVRDALKTGRSLTWSPLSDKRSPRPSAAESTIIGAPAPEAGLAVAEGARGRRAPRAASALAGAAGEIEDERYEPAVRERGNPLGKILAGLFVLAVLGVIGLVWYGSQFLAIPNDIQVPNLVGKTMDDARQMAVQQHFTLVEGGSDFSTKWPEDQIYQQDPLPGRTIKAEKEVTVYRSLGPRLLKVPRLVGETKDRAQSDLQETGLPAGTVTNDYSETVQSGVVLSQSPDPESMVARNTAVNFVVSKGRQPPDPPSGVEATASDMNTVDLRWDATPRAESYTIYRSLNGDTTTLSKALVDTQFTDRGLKPDTSYSYTIDAVNASGASGASEAVIVTTPPKPVATPILPKTTQVVTPPDNGPTPSLDGSTTVPATEPKTPPTAKMRQFTISFHVPRHPKRERLVQFEVQDVTGTNLVYSEKHQPGDEVNAPVQAFGNKITFRIFIDGSLLKQQTL
jgi:hypothetical protein